MEEQSYEDRFVIWVTLPSLKEMAACSFARDLLIYFFSRISNKFNIEGELCEISQFHASKFIADSQEIPSPIKETLKSCLNKANRSLLNWINHLRKDLFSDVLETYRMTCFYPELCVWYPNGEINYEKSAKKTLSGPGLSEIQRFAIMCEYCLEEQFANVDVISFPQKFIEDVYFNKDYLLYYWIYRLRNEFHRIPRRNFNSVDKVMASMCFVWNVEAFKYFWHRLGTHAQIPMASALFIRPYKQPDLCRVLKKHLQMMSHDQQIKLLREIPEYIISILCCDDRSNFPHTVFWAWRNCKDVMTPLQFYDIVKQMLFDSGLEFQEEIMQVLIELWQTAPDSHKNFAQNILRDEIFSEFRFQGNPFDIREMPFSRRCEKSQLWFKFLCMFFSTQNAVHKRSIMLRSFRFAANSVTRFLTDLVDVCLPNANDRLQFKSTVARSFHFEGCCEMTLKRGQFDELNSKLEYYLPDVESRRNFQQTMIHSLTTANFSFFSFGTREWGQLNDFICEAYVDNKKQASKHMKQIGFRLNLRLSTGDTNICETSDDFINIANRVFTGRKLVEFKNNFRHFIKGVYLETRLREGYWGRFNEIIFSKLIPWCLEKDEEAILRFKNEYLPVDVIFNAMVSSFNKCLDSNDGFDCRIFSQLDGCLKWYLGNQEKVEEYKVKRMKRSDDLLKFKANLQVKAAEGRWRLILMLPWFFNGDETAVGEFITNHLISRNR